MKKGEKKNTVPKENRKTLLCKDCKNDLPREYFSEEGKTSSGKKKYRSRCKQCFLLYRKAKGWKSKRAVLVEQYKEKCDKCGYRKYKGALDFHHRVSELKKFEISDAVYSRKAKLYTDDEVVKEIKKCIILCANCHREVHGGITKL